MNNALFFFKYKRKECLLARTKECLPPRHSRNLFNLVIFSAKLVRCSLTRVSGFFFEGVFNQYFSLSIESNGKLD